MRGVLIVLSLLATGCGTRQAPLTDSPPSLYLYCGAGLRPPVAELAELFTVERGVKVECDYAGSEVLLSRAKLSQRGDLFLPGDSWYVETASQQGLTAEEADVCYFVPTILVAKGNPQNVRSLRDLLRNDVRWGLGDPEVCAVGRQTVKLLEKNGLDPVEVEKNVVFRSATVNELGNHVKLGSVDAAIVWDGVAASFLDKADMVTIPPEQNVVSTVRIAVLRSSSSPESARQFLRFMTGDRGREIFEKRHYTTQLPR